MSKPETSGKAPAPDAAPKVRFTAHRPQTPSVPPQAPKATAAVDKMAVNKPAVDKAPPPKEIGGPKGPEPTRFGDWERDGRCVDF